jgi:hypothetical protein
MGLIRVDHGIQIGSTYDEIPFLIGSNIGLFDSA